MTQDQSTPGAASAGPADDPAVEASAARPTPGPPSGTGRGTGSGTGSHSGVGELEGLDDLPVAEHVERFTAVHDALRARLDGAPDAAPDIGQDDAPDAGPRR